MQLRDAVRLDGILAELDCRTRIPNDRIHEFAPADVQRGRSQYGGCRGRRRGLRGGEFIGHMAPKRVRGMITPETAVENAKEIAERVLAPLAGQNDKEARFSTEAVDALGKAELLGLMVPAESKQMVCRPASTTWWIIWSSRGRQQCCACSKPKRLRAMLQSR
jgi:hypothetical protein